MKKLFLAALATLLVSPALSTPIDLTKYAPSWSDEFDDQDQLDRQSVQWPQLTWRQSRG